MIPERWRKLNFFDKLRAISAEIKRAEIWENKDEELYKAALERALELIDLSLDKPAKQDEIYTFLTIKERVGELYAGRVSGASLLYSFM